MDGREGREGVTCIWYKKNQYNAENFRETISAQKALSLTNY